MHYRLILAAIAALALIAMPGHAETRDPFQPSPPAKLTGAISIGGGTQGLRLDGDRPTTLVVEGNLRIHRALGPLSLGVGARHCVSDNAYWFDKSHLSAGFDVPLGKDALLFATWERRYRLGDNWSMAGIRFHFSSAD